MPEPCGRATGSAEGQPLPSQEIVQSEVVEPHNSPQVYHYRQGNEEHMMPFDIVANYYRRKQEQEWIIIQGKPITKLKWGMSVEELDKCYRNYR